ncbi:MAG: replication-associated recombination protein A [Bacteroidales bacterium]|nr:replication-associated recombination protein A [Bacteroidales bacterium]
MKYTPLAEILRPSSLDEIVGQDHLLGKDGPIRKFIEKSFLPSLIFWGPPGCGKTTLAYVLAKALERPSFFLSAVEAGVKEVREIIKIAEKKKGTILFIDEIHRFNKAQQEYILHAVEKGNVVLIGATTENPSFEVVPPLLSRCQVYVLQNLDIKSLSLLLDRAKNYYHQHGITLNIKEKDALFYFSAGDARKLYNIIELSVEANPSQVAEITNQLVEEIVLKKFARFDKAGDQHYDTISAFIKSVRGSDPHAALYWLARMLDAGEDPLFIARRLIILAAEDIGLANPNAILLANATFDVVHKIGMPEARIPLAECTIYLAASPKSNSAYLAIEKALQLAKNTCEQPVPLHLRNAPTSLMQSLHYGKEYLYPHQFPHHFILQEYFPEKLKGTTIYIPASNPRENELKTYLLNCWKDKYDLNES